MSRLLFAWMLLTSWFCVTRLACANEAVAAVPAQQKYARGQVVTLELIDAHREYQAAKLRMHEYRFVALPQQRRLLEQEAKSTEAEMAMLKRRLRDYEPFLRVGDYSPARTAAESHRLALLSASQRLQQIKSEQRGLMRLSRQQAQLYKLDVLRAATRMTLAKGALAQSMDK